MVVTPERVVNLLDVPSSERRRGARRRRGRDRRDRHARCAAGPSVSQSLSGAPPGDRRHRQHAAPVPGHARRRSPPAAPVLVLPRRPRPAWPPAASWPAEGDNRFHAILGNQGAAKFVSRLADRPGADRPGRDGPRDRPGRSRREVRPGRAALPHAAARRRTRKHAAAEPAPHAHPAAAGRRHGQRHVRSAPRRRPGLSARCRRGRPADRRGRRPRGAKSCSATSPRRRGSATKPPTRSAAGRSTPNLAEAAGAAAVAEATPLSNNDYKVQLAKVAVKRAILRAAGLETGGF